MSGSDLRRSSVLGRVLAAACSLPLLIGPAAAVSATANRVWVSAAIGVDQPGCAAPTSPCRSLQYAHDNAVAAGGEIDIRDPGGYGAVNITKALSIVNDGVGTAGVQASSGAAIAINAAAGDAVSLRGLNVDGIKGAGANGILLVSVGALTIDQCVVRHFSQSGISLSVSSGTTQAVVENTQSSDNAGAGILITSNTSQTFFGVIDRVIAVNNANGIQVSNQSGMGAMRFSVTNTIASTNSVSGVTVDSPTSVDTRVGVDLSFMDLNGSYGLSDTTRGVVYLSRSIIRLNTVAGVNNATGNPGAVFTASNNSVDGNGVAVTGLALISAPTR